MHSWALQLALQHCSVNLFRSVLLLSLFSTCCLFSHLISFFLICFISLQSNSALAAGLSRRSSSLCQQCSCSLNCDISFFLGSLPLLFHFSPVFIRWKLAGPVFFFFFQCHLHSYYSYSPDSYPVKSAFKCYSSSAVRTEFNVYPGHFCNDFIHFTRRSFWK